ncbi:DUF6929 family protein [Flavobacterium sp. RSB2_4_14]|uniref:DUF6929 family protein n=1 Tax=Flavobacterium sp. RSB2_4_14 TaxID=3447665 RepID=UPI003F319496
MEKIQLSILFKIIGIGSASGLVYHDDTIYVISDNSTYLYEYKIVEEKLNKIGLVSNPQENIIKKDKADFESITLKGNDLILLGSGSTEKRNQIFKFNINSKKVKEKSFAEFYKKIKSELNINEDELNIEGLITTDKTIYLFQRGNGGTSKNGIIYANDDPENPKFKFIPFELPKIKNIETSFTDAILVENKIYFLAAAEDTTSTYEDGEVLGSIIGTIDLETMKLENYFQISEKNKFEGLTLYKKTATHIELLLCEDNDTDVLETDIFKLIIEN